MKTTKTEKQYFYKRVHALVKKIPKGKVSTYGEIASVLGTKSSSRMVGYALACADIGNVPCHRVVNRYGALTGKHNFPDINFMQRLLEHEQVTFDDEGCVIMEKHFYSFQARQNKKPRTLITKRK